MSDNDISFCPVCSSWDTEGKGLEFEGDQVIQPCFCNECEAEWSIVFKASAIHINEQGKKGETVKLENPDDKTDEELSKLGYAYSNRERFMARNVWEIAHAKGFRKGVEHASPDRDPITFEKFFCLMEHPQQGLVATYGGPYNSFTLARPDIEPLPEGSEPRLRREVTFTQEDYDHDIGGWHDHGQDPGFRVVTEEETFDLE